MLVLVIPLCEAWLMMTMVMLPFAQSSTVNVYFRRRVPSRARAGEARV